MLLNDLIFVNIKCLNYNRLNAKLSNSQFNKLKSTIKNETEVVLGLSSNRIGDSDDETNFPHKLFLTNRIDKLQILVKLLQIIHQLILHYQKLNYLR